MSERSRPTAAEGVQVLALFNLAVAYPLLDLLVKAPTLVAASGIDSLDVLLLTGLLCLVLPLGLVLVEAVVGRVSRDAHRLLHAFLIGQLSGLLVMRWVRHLLPDDPGWAVAVFVQTAVLVTAAWLAWRGTHAYFTALAPAIVVIPAVILLSPLLRHAQPRTGPSPALAGGKLPGPIVIVLFDELPLVSLLDAQRGIDAARFPSFAALARQSTWYANASTVAPQTLEVMPSLLTGCYPTSSGYAGGSDPASTAHLFALLGRTHRACSFEVITHMAATSAPAGQAVSVGSDGAGLLARLVAMDVQWLTGQREDEGAPPTFQIRTSPQAGRIPDVGLLHAREQDRLRDFLDSLRAGDSPAYYFFHSLMPHGPWNYLPSGRRYLTSWMLPNRVWPDLEQVVDYGQQRHLLQVGLADRMLGQLMEKLRSEGMWDPALVLVLSDHGLVFAPGQDDRVMAPGVMTDLAAIPFFLKLPGQREGAVSDRNVEIVDVLPTLAEAVGTRPDWAVDGASLLGPDPQRKGKSFVGLPDGLPSSLPLAASRWRRKLDLFGSGFEGRFYSLGPGPELVGQAAAPLVVQDAATRPRSSLLREEAYARIDLAAESLPVCVEGRIEQAADAPTPVGIAIAVNGRIQAVPFPFALSPGQYGFSAMIPERALREGPNDVAIYCVERRGGLVLRPTRR